MEGCVSESPEIKNILLSGTALLKATNYMKEKIKLKCS